MLELDNIGGRYVANAVLNEIERWNEQLLNVDER